MFIPVWVLFIANVVLVTITLLLTTASNNDISAYFPGKLGRKSFEILSLILGTALQWILTGVWIIFRPHLVNFFRLVYSPSLAIHPSVILSHTQMRSSKMDLKLLEDTMNQFPPKINGLAYSLPSSCTFRRTNTYPESFSSASTFDSLDITPILSNAPTLSDRFYASTEAFQPT